MCLFTRCFVYLAVLRGFKKDFNHEGHQVSRRDSLVRNHSLYFVLVSVTDQCRSPELILTLLGL